MPLRSRKSFDKYDRTEVEGELEGFHFDYFYSGKREGKTYSNLIELVVVTFCIDANENLFYRYTIYYGEKKLWKEVILNQSQNFLRSIGISESFVQSTLRYFEVSSDKYLPEQKFKQKFFELNSRSKNIND